MSLPETTPTLECHSPTFLPQAAASAPCCAGKSLGSAWLEEFFPQFSADFMPDMLQNVGAAVLAESFVKMQSLRPGFASQTIALNLLQEDSTYFAKAKQVGEYVAPDASAAAPCPAKKEGRDFLTNQIGRSGKEVHLDLAVWALCDIMKQWRSLEKSEKGAEKGTQVVKGLLTNALHNGAWMDRLPEAILNAEQRTGMKIALETLKEQSLIAEKGTKQQHSCCMKKKAMG